MNLVYGFYASRNYWKDEKELGEYYNQIKDHIVVPESRSHLINDMEDVEKMELTENDTLIIIPMSGAVQQAIVASANKAKHVIVYAAYISGNVSDNASQLMLTKNAAPTVMDSWGVLRREHKHSRIAQDIEELNMFINVFLALEYIKDSKIILVGDTEPWVISNSSKISDYEKLGVKVQQVLQQEVADIYNELTDEDAEEYYDHFRSGASKLVEPTEEDVKASSRMAAALLKIMEKYDANGMALACFNLLNEGTNGCLGVSYINDCTDDFVSCEGDLDSAVTMLIMKKIASSKLWMANPGLHPNGVVNFSHCTAPINIKSEGNRDYILRNHHESGIGTSLQVDLPLDQVVTACRISDNVSKMTINRGVSIEGKYENVCRTQLYIKFDDFEHYINTALGCHQVFAFEDIVKPMEILAEELGLEII